MTSPIFKFSYIPELRSEFRDAPVAIPETSTHQSPVTSKSATTPKRTLWNKVPKAHPKIDPFKSMQASTKPKIVKKEPVIDEEFQKILDEGFQAVVTPEPPKISGLSGIKFTSLQ